jgi:hypothetical protein
MSRMTDEEADALDEKWTKHPPEICANGTGFFSRHKAAYIVALDDFSADWLLTKEQLNNNLRFIRNSKKIVPAFMRRNFLDADCFVFFV